jgi:hypothetical protein
MERRVIWKPTRLVVAATVAAAASLAGLGHDGLTAGARGQRQIQWANRTEARSTCNDLRTWTARNEGLARLFGATSTGYGYEPKKSTWREHPTQEALDAAGEGGNQYYVAKVWTARDGSLVVKTAERSFSDDWGLFLDYCYRPSGTVAFVSVELFFWPSRVLVREDIEFDASGREIARTTGHFDIKGEQVLTTPEKTADDWLRHTLVVYRRSSDLPFHKIYASKKAKH